MNAKRRTPRFKASTSVRRGHANVEMRPATDGAWVQYTDHAAEVARLRAAIDEIRNEAESKTERPYDGYHWIAERARAATEGET